MNVFADGLGGDEILGTLKYQRRNVKAREIIPVMEASGTQEQSLAQGGRYTFELNYRWRVPLTQACVLGPPRRCV